MTPLPSWPRRLRRIALWSLAAMVVLALVAGLVGVWTARRPFPQYGGELALASLSAPVTVHRDSHGVPQVYAQHVADLFRAQGYLHAQDRFWEMDLRRHVTSGRTAELFGEGQVEADAFLRTLGWRRVAEAEWEIISTQARRYLTAYAEGVDAWIEETGGPAATGSKALQYPVLGLRNSGYEVAPWDPVDSLAWLKAMAWDLRGNMEAEIDRAAMVAGGLTRAQVEELYPRYPYQRHAPIVADGRVVDGAFEPGGGSGEPDTGAAAGGAGAGGAGAGGAGAGGVPAGELPAADATLTALSDTVARMPEPMGGAGPGIGSNSWVVSGDLTATGAPILVNDPHLGVTMPGIWHQMGLHCSCGYRVSGFTFSGVPGVVIGHNDRIAWGFTNLNADVTDLYLERLDGDRYQLDGQWRDLDVWEETIGVAGGDEVTIQIRRTHRGPLLSDASEQLHELAASDLVTAQTGDAAGGSARQDGYGVSLAWTALRPGRTIEALFALNRAGSWDEFREAAALFEVPAQNLVYADVDGTIGYQAPGVVPVRATGDGRWMAPGWDSAYDWQDYYPADPDRLTADAAAAPVAAGVPFDELPYLRDPDAGFIVTANQAVVGPQYQPWLTADWSYGYRSHRIRRLLTEAAAAGPIEVSDMERMLFDNRNLFAPSLTPALVTGPTAPLSRGEAAALDLLREWDFRQPAGGEPGTPDARSAAAAAYFNATWRHLLALLFDELPEEQQPNGRDRWFAVVRSLLDEPASAWWDRADTDTVETRDDVLSRALSDAYQELAVAQGDDPRQWRWGQMHTLLLRDGTFGTSGIAPIEALFNRGPFETAGGSDILNATGWVAADGYEVTAAPSMRMIIDMSDFDSSRWVQMTGNSGHPYHQHHLDQLELWRTGGMLAMRWDPDTIEAEAAHTLTLAP